MHNPSQQNSQGLSSVIEDNGRPAEKQRALQQSFQQRICQQQPQPQLESRDQTSREAQETFHIMEQQQRFLRERHENEHKQMLNQHTAGSAQVKGFSDDFSQGRGPQFQPSWSSGQSPNSSSSMSRNANRSESGSGGTIANPERRNQAPASSFTQSVPQSFHAGQSPEAGIPPRHLGPAQDTATVSHHSQSRYEAANSSQLQPLPDGADSRGDQGRQTRRTWDLSSPASLAGQLSSGSSSPRAPPEIFPPSPESPLPPPPLPQSSQSGSKPQVHLFFSK